MKNKFYLLIVFLSAFLPSISGNEREMSETVKVRGEVIVSTRNLRQTFAELEEEARQAAKQEAIKKVCGEQISIWDRAESSASGDSFNTLTVNRTTGEIADFEIIEEGHTQSLVRETEMIFYCIAKVKVKRGTDIDPNFKAKVEGIKSAYYVGELLKFIVTPYKDCYLKIFSIASGRGDLLYPDYDYDTVEQFKANKKYAFPILKEMDYPLEKNVPQPIEKTELVFVFTKDECPFNIDTHDPQEIEQWVAGIPTDRKYIEFRVFDVK